MLEKLRADADAKGGKEGASGQGQTMQMSPEMMKMMQQDPRIQQQTQGAPEPDGELLPEQVPDMLARLLDQVQAPEIDVASADLANITSADTIRDCLPPEVGEAFVGRAGSGLVQLLKQRPSTVRKGVLQLAEAAVSLAEDAEARCGGGAEGAVRLAELARRLAAATRHKSSVEYKKLELLKISGVDIREKMNAFAFVWKVCKASADARALGKALGELLMLFARGTQGTGRAEL